MLFETSLVELEPVIPFAIARGTKFQVTNVFLQLQIEGIRGIGEASPNAYYGENAQDVKLRLDRWLTAHTLPLPRSIEDIYQITESAAVDLAPSRSAQCALDLALWDIYAKSCNQSVCELVWGHKLKPVLSSITWGLTPFENWEKQFALTSSSPILKIKCAGSGYTELWEWLSARYTGKIRLDANGAWSERQLIDFLESWLRSAQVGKGVVLDFLEQPLSPALCQNLTAQSIHIIQNLKDQIGTANKERSAQNRGGAFLIADESLGPLKEIEKLLPFYDGINIKLTKCGGISPALLYLQKAKALGLKTMIGCMLESEVLIAAGMVVAQQADYADLDGRWLLKSTPWEGWDFKNGSMYMEDGIGLQVRMGQKGAPS